jgi:hypothetical protein
VQRESVRTMDTSIYNYCIQFKKSFNNTVMKSAGFIGNGNILACTQFPFYTTDTDT